MPTAVSIPDGFSDLKTLTSCQTLRQRFLQANILNLRNNNQNANQLKLNLMKGYHLTF